MKRPRVTIFVRVLLASLVPLVLISCALLLLMNNIILDIGSNHVRETTELFARQVSERILSIYNATSAQLALIARNMTDVIEPTPEARESVRNMTLSLIRQNRNIYSARFVFKPWFLQEGSRLYKTYIEEHGIISEIHDVTDHVLDDPSLSQWYNVPLYSAEPFFDIINHYDFKTGRGPRYVCTLVYPVISGGTVAGCVRADMLYEDILEFMDNLQEEGERLVLFLAEGDTILYSPDKNDLDLHLAKFGFEPRDEALLSESISHKKNITMEIFSPFFKEKSLIYLAPIDVPGANETLFLYVDQPIGPLYRKVVGKIRLIAYVSLAGLFLLMTSVFFVVRNLVRPVKEITANAELIAGGRLDIDLGSEPKESEPRHEVDMLNRALRKMYGELKQNHALRMKAVEEEYRRKQAEEASEAKTRFFANMSHEIRTPMNAILGISEILLAGDLGDRERKYISDIRSSSEALIGIINDILDISRLETGKLTLVSVHFDFPALIENIVAIGTFLASEKGLDFRYEACGETPEYLCADDVRLRQILMNLIGNAIKFTDRGFVKLTVTAKETSLFFEVEDTGIGIGGDDMPHLFDAFRQADLKKNRNTKGAGLGLSISMNLAKAMGGSISVASEYGNGSKFTLCIPRADGDPKKVSDAYSADAPLAFGAPEARVLIVDDNEINLDVAAGMIGFYEIACDTAESGAQAIEMLGRNDYDAIFMDHMMPGMDGIEATKAIRAMGGKYAKMPIIALTANAVVGTRELFLSSGMNDFVAKPIERHKLHSALLKWIPGDKIIAKS